MAKTKLDAQTKSHIRNLLMILGGAVTLAVGAAAVLVTYYGPDGAYTAKNVLLEPHVLENLSYTEPHPSTGRETRFVFAGVQFYFFDRSAGRWREKSIDIATFTKFFNMIASERSVLKDLPSVQKIFDTNVMARLSLRVAAYSNSPEPPGVIGFQDIQFVENGDYYRVELHDAAADTTWAYFYHPNIYQKVVTLFNP